MKRERKAKQEEFSQLVRDKKRKRLQRIISRLFADIQESLDFVTALVKVFLEENLSSDSHQLAEEFIHKARSRFAQLSPERALEVLRIYYKDLIAAISSKKAMRFGFDIVNILGGSRKGEELRAKRIIALTLEMIHKDPLPEKGEFPRGQVFLWGLIALANISFTWENLIKSARNDSEARALLKKVMYTLTIYGVEEFKFVSTSQWNPERDLIMGFPQKAIPALGLEGRVIRLPIPSEHQKFMEEVLKEYLQERTEQIKECALLISWFGENIERFRELFKQMWIEIQAEPKHGLRTGGRDRIKIGIKALEEIGVLSLQFFPEEASFPAVKVKFWLKEFEEPYSLTFLLSKPDLSEYVVAKKAYAEDHPKALIDQLYAYIALHCYWRIVTGKSGLPFIVTLPEEISPAEVSQRRLRAREPDYYRSFTIVRPHFRHLPLGYQPTEEAIGRALEAFQSAPPLGYTFVREHPRGLGEVESIEPIFTYREEDLGYGGNLD